MQSIVPRTHRTPDGREGPVLPRVAEVAARPEDGHPDETGGALRRGEQRSVLRMAELLPKAVTPTVDPGDVLIFDSWVLCVS